MINAYCSAVGGKKGTAGIGCVIVRGHDVIDEIWKIVPRGLWKDGDDLEFRAAAEALFSIMGKGCSDEPVTLHMSAKRVVENKGDPGQNDSFGAGLAVCMAGHFTSLSWSLIPSEVNIYAHDLAKRALREEGSDIA